MENIKQDEWLELAKDAFNSSTSFIDTHCRESWEDRIRHFKSKHHSGSKYNKDAYKYRSKFFSPKTRASVRSNEAAAAHVFFSSDEILSIEARDPNDQVQVASAALNKELVKYRLQESIPWYMTCLGGLQDAQVIGLVCSKQYWDYEEREDVYEETQVNELTGEPVLDETDSMIDREVTRTAVTKDKPCIDLIAVENIRFHPNSDWRNIVEDSPYLIVIIPMYAGDVKEKMRRGKWKQLSDDEIFSTVEKRDDTTENVRRDNVEDTETNDLSDFDIVYVHEIFVRKEGEDYTYKTLSTEYRLTDPKETVEEYPQGRPIVVGVSVIEAHNPYPDSLVSLGSPQQKEINEIKNQRRDNVQLVLNKRWFVRRGANIDVKSMTRNVPGSVTLMGDPHADVLEKSFDDVTASAYHEEDRSNLLYDELVGTFSGSSIQSNRRMNETVGGMQMLQGSVNTLTEYLLMTFAETWVEPVMKQLIVLEQEYESDTTVLALAAQKAQLLAKFNISDINDTIIKQQLYTNVSVGLGATDPMFKLERFLLGVTKSMEVQQAAANLGPAAPNVGEIQKEIWGRLGYKDGTRFVGANQDKQQAQMIVQKLQQELAALRQELEDKNADRQVDLMKAQIRERGQDRRKEADILADLQLKEMEIFGAIDKEKVKGSADLGKEVVRSTLKQAG